MRKLYILTPVILLFLYLSPLSAQTGTLFTADNVLSNSHVNCILQDSKNYIWIATENGLNKFDGNRFTIYLNNQQEQNILLNNYVRTLFEDSKGRLWVGCLNGIMLYNRAEDTFTEVPVFYQSKKYNPHITSIIELSSGEIVVATSGAGLLRSTSDFKSFRVDENLFNKLSSRYLTTVLQAKNGDLWIGSENQGVNRVLHADKSILSFNSNYGNISNQVSDICADNAGNIYIGTLTGGLYVVEKSGALFTHIPYVNPSITLPVKNI